MKRTFCCLITIFSLFQALEAAHTKIEFEAKQKSKHKSDREDRRAQLSEAELQQLDADFMKKIKIISNPQTPQSEKTVAFKNLQQLAEEGADIEGKNRDPKEESPLQTSVYDDDNNKQLFQYLLDQGYNVNENSPNAATALELATLQGRPDIVKTLLDKGANTNAYTLEHSPLMTAAHSGFVEIVKMLLAHRANPFLKDKRQQTARMLAERKSRTTLTEDELNRLHEIITLLQNAEIEFERAFYTITPRN